MSTAYASARDAYASLGVNTDKALEILASVPLSLHCWQGDDVGGFETAGSTLNGGGIQVTGNYPGKARTVDELRADLDRALTLIPAGRPRLNLHASYAEFGPGQWVDRDRIGPEHFAGWIDWARARRMGLDFNPTYFSHPKAASGYTLSHRDSGIRRFWIDHGIACRKIGEAMGRALGTPAVTNVWIPDGCKDVTADRLGPRQRLTASLDEIFKDPIDPAHNLDAVESKLFGIGSESYVVGSHEFYLGYAITRRKLLCLDMGHFHPTESVADKVSSVLPYVPGLLLHVSRGVRWDSDHVVLFDEATRGLFEEVVRGGFLGKTYVGLDFFDGSINRVAAWVIGSRNALKSLLAALLEPTARLRSCEEAGDPTALLALTEDCKTLPFGAVWSEYCSRRSVPDDRSWIGEVQGYEREVLSKRA
jgi:L-rhamnose isomerase